MEGTEITTKHSTTGAWIWAIICGLYAISPIDIIPDGLLVAIVALLGVTAYNLFK